VEVHLALHPISSTIIGKTGDIGLADSPDTKLECITLPHAVNVTTLEPFAGRLRFYLDSDEKTVFL
jgi:hypothetical protein